MKSRLKFLVYAHVLGSDFYIGTQTVTSVCLPRAAAHFEQLPSFSACCGRVGGLRGVEGRGVEGVEGRGVESVVDHTAATILDRLIVIANFLSDYQVHGSPGALTSGTVQMWQWYFTTYSLQQHVQFPHRREKLH